MSIASALAHIRAAQEHLGRAMNRPELMIVEEYGGFTIQDTQGHERARCFSKQDAETILVALRAN